MKFKERLQYWKDIKSGNSIPLFNCYINLNKFKIQKEGSCEAHFHPIIFNELSEDKRKELYYHINKSIDIVRDNIEDINKLK